MKRILILKAWRRRTLFPSRPQARRPLRRSFVLLCLLCALFLSGSFSSPRQAAGIGTGSQQSVRPNHIDFPDMTFSADYRPLSFNFTPQGTPSWQVVTVEQSKIPLGEAVTPTPISSYGAKDKLIALSFDDGPYAPVDSRILAALKEAGWQASFFVVGNRLPSNGDSLKAILAGGHEIGNHSQSHANFNHLDLDSIRWEFAECGRQIKEHAGVWPSLARSPYGIISQNVLQASYLPLIQWSLDTLDWKVRDSAAVRLRVLEAVRPGSVVLMHSLYPTTAEAVEQLIPELKAAGYRSVTLSALFQAYAINLSAGQVYHAP